MRSAGFGKCLIQETHRMQKRMAGFYILPALLFYGAIHPKKLPVAGSVGVPGMTLFAKKYFFLDGLSDLWYHV